MRMNRARAVGIAAALIALAATTAATAAAPSVRLSGHAAGDKETTVRVSAVPDRDGATKVLKRFRFKKVLAKCDGSSEPQRITIKLTGRIPVAADRTYKRTFDGGASGIVKVSGQISRNGARTAGVVRSPAIEVSGAGVCKLPATSFAARA